MEGVTKYRAGFGGADIKLVVDSVTGNVRVPEVYKTFATEILGRLPELFGFVMPLLETVLGVVLIIGVLTLPAACVSIGTLTMYWLADQLIGQYPIMLILSAVILVSIGAATRFSVTRLSYALRRRH